MECPKKEDINYIISEASSLRGNMLHHLSNIELLEKNALLISGAIWVLIASITWVESLKIIIWFPSILTAIFYIKLKMLTLTIHLIGEYLIKLENQLSLPNDLGWQNYWNIHKYKHSRFKKSYLKFWGGIYWMSLFMGNTLVALYFPFQTITMK